MRPLLEPATRLAAELDHPAYDCLYLALAPVRRRDMVRADAALGRKVLPRGLACRVMVLD